MEIHDSTLIDALRSIFLFEALDDKRLSYVGSCSTLLHISKGEHLFRAGDPARYFFGLSKGSCKLYRISSNGDEFVVHIQKQGDLVAEAAIFDISKYPAYCIALEDCSFVRLSAKGFIAILLDHPELGLDLMHAYSRRLRSFVTALEDISIRDVKARLARYLLANACEDNGRQRCPLQYSKKELAALIGTIPETLSRTLREFKNHGAIEEHNWGFIIHNPQFLKSLAGE